MFSQTRLPFRAIMLLLIAVLVFSGISFAQPSPVSAQGCFPFYIVKPGDNLYRIAVAANTSWQTLAVLNGITNPNRILVGQRICLPAVPPGVTPTAISPVTVTPRPTIIATATFVPTPVPGVPTSVPGGIVLPPPGIFPSIQFNTFYARIGDTLTITGINFPTNEPVNIYITNFGTAYPASPSGSAVTSATGTLSTTFVIPAAVDAVQLNSGLLSVLVRGRVTGYYGYNYFTRLQ